MCIRDSHFLYRRRFPSFCRSQACCLLSGLRLSLCRQKPCQTAPDARSVSNRTRRPVPNLPFLLFRAFLPQPALHYPALHHSAQPVCLHCSHLFHHRNQLPAVQDFQNLPHPQKHLLSACRFQDFPYYRKNPPELCCLLYLPHRWKEYPPEAYCFPAALQLYQKMFPELSLIHISEPTRPY